MGHVQEACLQQQHDHSLPNLQCESKRLGEARNRTNPRLSRPVADQVAAEALMDAVAFAAEALVDAVAAPNTAKDTIARSSETRFATLVAVGMSRIRAGRSR